MIVCKLSAILGDRRIKVSDVVRGTSIARATLDRYFHDRIEAFDREVLEKLCRFLQVPLTDLLVEVPDVEQTSKLDHGGSSLEPVPPQNSKKAKSKLPTKKATNK
jgi:putative transcriptional regulator